MTHDEAIARALCGLGMAIVGFAIGSWRGRQLSMVRISDTCYVQASEIVKAELFERQSGWQIYVWLKNREVKEGALFVDRAAGITDLRRINAEIGTTPVSDTESKPEAQFPGSSQTPAQPFLTDAGEWRKIE